MKRPLLIFISFVLVCCNLRGQDDIQNILKAGLDDATTFSKNYIAPVSEGIIYSMANGWYNSGEAKKLLHFEVSIVPNVAFVPEEKQNFRLNTEDYNYIQFPDGATSKSVASVLGHNEMEQTVIVQYQTENGTETTNFTLPQGLGDENLNFLPTAYLQASVGLVKGFEVKARFLPELEYDGAKTNLYGAALQHEFTSWLTPEIFPIKISALVGYNKFEASYALEQTQIQANNQAIETEMSSWIFTAIASTNWPVINFYGGLGYIKGDATTSLKGTYTLESGPLHGQTLVNPYSVDTAVNGVNATLGTKLKLGFFRLHAAYSFQKYQNVNVGLNFGY
ncbi:DUF6588 family protein [Haloflavibacter putidus]|uniref:MetA-pathway of phenol degradation n=1 Tax=Haloflavibacter putidus TaxID=2576776 RepID=A0A507ZDR3_9FLAO|nr:DUF6588 family protein [Haloflavibacter putidus]TQD34881.1 hypothetical protein FKR84_11850 [Haloflavibacter putidus]